MIGIYKIENKVNGKVYIGQSIDINNRWCCHKAELRHNNHNNKYLQNSWNTYGEDNFNFTVVEECNYDELNDKEIYWIEKYDSYNNGYNLTLGGDGTRLVSDNNRKEIINLFNSPDNLYTSEEISQIIGCSAKTVRRILHGATCNNECNYDPNLSKGVAVICLNTLEIFYKIDDAEEKYNTYGISACCKKQIKYSGVDKNNEPLLWMYLDEYNTYNKDELEQYKQNILLKIKEKYPVCLNTRDIFKTTEQAILWCGLKEIISIQKCCTHKAFFAGKDKCGNKLVWVYYKEYITMTDEEIYKLIAQANKRMFTKEVICLNNLKIFNSALDASEYCNCNAEIIKNCCRGTANSAGKDPTTKERLTWIYLEDYQKISKEDINKKLKLSKYRYTNPDKMKSIICLNTLEVFNSQKDAAKWCGLKNCSMIGYNMRKGLPAGKHPSTNEKLNWMYYNDYLELNNKSNLEEQVS